MKSLTVLSVSYKTPRYILQLMKSFEMFKPHGIEINYVVVENSNMDYEEDLLEVSPNVKLINNNCGKVGSSANAAGVELGKNYIESEYCFVCHSDVMVTAKSFFTYLSSKISEGYDIIGTGLDNGRINALHISGIFLKSSILKLINTSPVSKNGVMRLDVGDSLTEYARNNNIQHTCMRNTINDKGLCSILKEPYRSWGENCGIARALDDSDEVVFLHLGRGTPKHHKSYSKEGKKTSKDWFEIYENINRDIK